jgi:hypothetical protein
LPLLEQRLALAQELQGRRQRAMIDLRAELVGLSFWFPYLIIDCAVCAKVARRLAKASQSAFKSHYVSY